MRLLLFRKFHLLLLLLLLPILFIYVDLEVDDETASHYLPLY